MVIKQLFQFLLLYFRSIQYLDPIFLFTIFCIISILIYQFIHGYGIFKIIRILKMYNEDIVHKIFKICTSPNIISTELLKDDLNSKVFSGVIVVNGDLKYNITLLIKNDTVLISINDKCGKTIYKLSPIGIPDCSLSSYKQFKVFIKLIDKYFKKEDYSIIKGSWFRDMEELERFYTNLGILAGIKNETN